MAEEVNYVTITQYIEVGERTLLVLPTHILPRSSSQLAEIDLPEQGSSITGGFHQVYANLTENRRAHYEWFNDHCNQEVMVCVHGVINTEAVENLLCHRTQSKPSSATNKPAYEFRRSDNLRMLMTFRPVGHRQHLLLPNLTSSDQNLVSKAAFISEYGRRVLPYLGTSTVGGAGYTSYKILPEALHVYVDSLELTSSHGIFKLLRSLEPKHSLSTDIPSYFKLKAEEEAPEVLPQAPGAALKQKFSDKSTRSSRRLRKNKGRSGNQETKSKPQVQPTILQVFANYQPKMQENEADKECIPEDVLEHIWDFDSSQPSQFEFKAKESGLSEGEGTVLPQQQSKCSSKLQVAATDCSQNRSALAKEMKGKKRPMLVTGHSSHSDAEKKRKTKLQHMAEQQDDQSPPDLELDFSDPIDELFANQQKTRDRCRSEGHKLKRQQKRTKDMCDDQAYVKANQKQYNETSTSSADMENDGLSPLSVNSPEALTNDVDDMFFDISTPEVSSPVTSFEADRDLALKSLQSEDFKVPALARRSASQPVSHSLSSEHSSASLPKRNKCCSDSALETEFNDITNIPVVASSNEDSSSSPSQIMSDLLSKHTKNPVAEQLECGDKVAKKKRKKKPVPTSAAEIFKGTKKVADLSHDQLSDWMRLNQPVLMDIFKRKQYSWRHEEFNTNPKMRAAMKWRYDSRRFTGDQVKLLTDILLKIFCWRHMKYFNYVMSVLLPESLVRIIADVHGVTFEEAEKLMFSFQGQATVDLTSD